MTDTTDTAALREHNQHIVAHLTRSNPRGPLSSSEVLTLESAKLVVAALSVRDGLPDADQSEYWFEHEGKLLFDGALFNSIVAIFIDSQLEAERQRLELVREQRDDELRTNSKLEAELAAMKGDQVPVAWRHESDILCHKVVTMSEVVAKSWIDKGRRVTPLYDRPQNPVVLPQAFAVRSGHPFNEGARTAMIPDDKGNWLSKFDVEHAIKMAGGIVKDGE